MDTFIPSMAEMVSLPGVPAGHITLLRGHSDTGKTTALLEVAVNAQKMGILPVFIVTEMKWSWEHAMMMGLEVDLEKDEDGNTIGVDGNFIFADRGQLPTVEAVAGFMADLMNEQKKVIYLWIWYSYGILLDLFHVKCQLKKLKIIMNGMLEQCLLNLVIL